MNITQNNLGQVIINNNGESWKVDKNKLFAFVRDNQDKFTTEREAYYAGKQIQWCWPAQAMGLAHTNRINPWRDCINPPKWDQYKCYRVKPEKWTPKFAVGDSVIVRALTGAPPGTKTEIVSICEVERSYFIKGWGGMYAERDLEWYLGSSVNGHTLIKDAKWHRYDFTKDMLPPGYRPLIQHPLILDVGEYEVFDRADNTWTKIPEGLGLSYDLDELDFDHCRTTRPMPQVVWLPLDWEDFPMGSYIRHEKLGYPYMPVTPSKSGFVVSPALTARLTYKQLFEGGYEIFTPTKNRWELCRKLQK